MLMTPASKSSKKNMLKGSHIESMRTLASPTDLAAAGAHRGPSPARRSAAGSLHPQEAKKTYGPYGRLGPWAQNSKQKNEEKKTCKNTLFCLWLFLFLLNYLSLGPKPKSISWVAEDLWNSNHSTQIHSAQKHPSQSLAVPNHRVALQGAHQHVFEGVSSRNSPEIWHFSEENDMFMCHRWSVIILTYSQVSS